MRATIPSEPKMKRICTTLVVTCTRQERFGNKAGDALDPLRRIVPLASGATFTVTLDSGGACWPCQACAASLVPAGSAFIEMPFLARRPANQQQRNRRHHRVFLG